MILLCQVITVVCLVIIDIAECNAASLMEHFEAIYDDYGTDWIDFLDGSSTPHNVSLIDDMGTNYVFTSRAPYSELEFRLYTRNGTNNTEESIVVNEPGTVNLLMQDFKLTNLPLKVITHGWRSSVESPAVKDIKDAYLQCHDVNVITVDWSYTANSIFYHWVSNQTKMIGNDVGTFLNALSKRYDITGDRIHLIGHSLGAHIMGIAAHYSNLTVSRITGLDPARPLFEYPSRGEEEKLDSSDAEFVDVIHTCGGILGIEASIGTTDFYPNSGIPPQPGCNTILKILEACSHSRSYYYFAESIINPRAFPAYQCSTWLEYLEKRCLQYGYMGDYVTRNNTGKFYLQTNPNRPYGRKNN